MSKLDRVNEQIKNEEENERKLSDASDASIDESFTFKKYVKPDDKPEIIPWSQRLFKQTKGKIKQKKTENDGLVSSLPSSTLKSLKSKRPIFSREKVAVSFSTDKQLRNIFEKFDIHNNKIIDLRDLQAAAIFVEETTLNSRQGPLKNIQKIFENMDDDGNGMVDYQEFTRYFTGSVKTRDNPISRMNDRDIERMYWKFSEYAHLIKREKALSGIIHDYNTITSKDTHTSKSKTKKIDLEEQKQIEKAERNKKIFSSIIYEDLERFQHFKDLFGVGEKKKDLFPIQGDDTTCESVDLMGVNLNTRIIESVVQNLIEQKKVLIDEKFQRDGILIDLFDTVDLEKEEFLRKEEPKLSPRMARHNEYIALEEKLLAERKEKLNKMEDDPESKLFYQRYLLEKNYIKNCQKRCSSSPMDMSRTMSGSRSMSKISTDKTSPEYIKSTDYLKLNNKNVSKDIHINRQVAKSYFVDVGSNAKAPYALTGPLPRNYKQPVKKLFKTPSGFLSFDTKNPKGVEGKWKLSNDDYHQNKELKLDLVGAVKLGILTLPDYQLSAFERDAAGNMKVKVDKSNQNLGGLSGNTATKKLFQEYRRGIYD